MKYRRHSAFMNQEPQMNAAEIPFNRACDSCRSHKVRCLSNNSTSSNACQRCAKTDRQCVFTAPQKRKQRKRTDTRVAELEREVQAMRALFATKEKVAKPDVGAQPAEQSVSSQLKKSTVNTTASISPPNFDGIWAPPSLQTPPATRASLSQDWNISGFSPNSDVIDRGLVSVDTATQLFNTYMDDLYQHYPAVPFPPGTHAEDVRRSQP